MMHRSQHLVWAQRFKIAALQCLNDARKHRMNGRQDLADWFLGVAASNRRHAINERKKFYRAKAEQ